MLVVRAKRGLDVTIQVMAVIDQGILRPGNRLIRRWWKRVGGWLAGGIVLMLVTYMVINGDNPLVFNNPWLWDFRFQLGDNLFPLLLLCWLIPSSIAVSSYENIRKDHPVPTSDDKYSDRFWVIISSTKWSYLATVLLAVVYKFASYHLYYPENWAEVSATYGWTLFFIAVGVALYGMWHVMLLVLLPKHQYLVWGLVGAGILAPYVRYLPVGGGNPYWCGTGLLQPDAFDNNIWILGLAILLGMLISYRFGHLLVGHAMYAMVVLAIVQPVFPEWRINSLSINVTYKFLFYLWRFNDLMTDGFPLTAFLYNSDGQYWPSPLESALMHFLSVAALFGLVYLLVFLLPRRMLRSRN